ncbi:MAG: DUF4839 domain-containing protein [Oscillospiraceae bacterium]|nr:DUF4839 domain-containing protein [Oscillospiraceae bacterium]
MDLDSMYIEDVLSVGDNIHVIAEVGSYDVNTRGFELDPVVIELR